MITYFSSTQPVQKPIFSILIPTWNNFDFFRLCVESIRKNSVYVHQIIVHINEGTDGTLAWVQKENLDYTYSEQNVGICLACNAARSLAQADYILYMNDDMYACPNWDKHLYQAIIDYGKDDFYFSATMIERVDTDYKCVSAPHDFGSDTQNFKEKELIEALPSLAIPDWQGATYPPSVMHSHTWDLIGGFSVEFSPGMYSDPDICMKLWQVGCRNFRGVGNSLVYHFISKSIGRVKKNNGKKQFLQKWSITPSVLFNHYIHLYDKNGDATYQGILKEPTPSFAYTMAVMIAKLKKLVSLIFITLHSSF
jgi:glycosyltransferase involved in cell wall biosynthesis